MGRLTYCGETMRAPAERPVGGAPAEDWTDLGQACISRLVAGFLSPESPAARPPDFTDGLRAQCVIAATLAAGEGRAWADVDYEALGAGGTEQRTASEAAEAVG